MTALAAALVAVAAAGRLAQEDPESPAATAQGAAFEADARHAPAHFDVAFTLSEREGGEFALRFLELVASGEADRVHEIALRFDPFEGGEWRYTAHSVDLAPIQVVDRAGRNAHATPLTQLAEPPGLRYELAVTLHAGGGISVVGSNGAPLAVVRTGAPHRWQVEVEPTRGVSDLAVSLVHPGGDAAIRAALAKATELPAPLSRLDLRAPTTPELSLATLRETSNLTLPLQAVRPLEGARAVEGDLARWILQPTDQVEIPLLLLPHDSESDDEAPPHGCALIVSGSYEGKSARRLLATAVEWSRSGHEVALIDLLGAGERREIAPYDSLDDFELRLTGSSADEVAADEVRQVAHWLTTRPQRSGLPFTLLLDAAAAATLLQANALAQEPMSTPIAALSVSPELVDQAVFGPDWLRARYDSDLLERAINAREELAPPDRAVTLAERMVGTPAQGALVLWEPTSQWRFQAERGFGRWDGKEALAAGPRILTLSDLGPLDALHAAAAAFSPLDRGATLVTCAHPFDRAPLTDQVATLRHVIRMLTVAGAKLRLYAEGACAVPLLMAAALEPAALTSVTARHAIVSFESLLARPYDAIRARAPLELLTQGMPEPLFVANALQRFELEECALELRARQVAVEWRDPVDALRRPLSRHQRLAMWPRVRRLEAMR